MSTAAATSVRDRAELSSAAAEVFGDRVDLARRYADYLSSEGIVRGVLGPREADRVWSRHLFNSAALAPLIPAGARVVDLGSGAGLPGIPLAIARPDLSMVLLEPLARRAAFLHDCLAALDLTAIEVVVGRAEVGLTPPPQVVVARAVAPLARLIGLADSLLVSGGTLLALKGVSAQDELDAARQVGPVDGEVLAVMAGGEPATVVRVVRPPSATTRRVRGSHSRRARPVAGGPR